MKHENHQGQVVSVGNFKVHLGGAMYKPLMSLEGYDVIVPFLESISRGPYFPEEAKVVHYPMQDFGGVPEDWKEFLDKRISDLQSGSKILAFCAGGHGRTGTFLASLIALLEPRIKDPIRTARQRYCVKAVETRRQAVAIFALKGAMLPAKYSNLHP